MQNYYVRFGQKLKIPSTLQIKHEIGRMALENPRQSIPRGGNAPSEPVVTTGDQTEVKNGGTQKQG
jgi:hypothetical protein